MSRDAAADARRVVVKVGSSVLTRDGAVAPEIFGRIAGQIAELAHPGHAEQAALTGGVAEADGEAVADVAQAGVPVGAEDAGPAAAVGGHVTPGLEGAGAGGVDPVQAVAVVVSGL